MKFKVNKHSPTTIESVIKVYRTLGIESKFNLLTCEPEFTGGYIRSEVEAMLLSECINAGLNSYAVKNYYDIVFMRASTMYNPFLELLTNKRDYEHPGEISYENDFAIKVIMWTALVLPAPYILRMDASESLIFNVVEGLVVRLPYWSCDPAVGKWKNGLQRYSTFYSEEKGHRVDTTEFKVPMEDIYAYYFYENREFREKYQNRG
jgi:hypothetical protein